MSILKKVLPLAALLVNVAHADEKSVQAAVEKFIGAQAVVSVQTIKQGGLYEVVLQGNQILYTDDKVSFLIDGRIIDTATRADLTRARIDDLSKIDIAKLPLDRAIKTVQGDGSRFLVTFEDPNCGYCKKLQKEIKQIDNVTVYSFLFPVLGQSSVQMSRNIWCAQDRQQVWLNWMLNGDTPAQAECEEAVIDKNLELGLGMGIHGTPAMFFADGRRIGGFIPKERIEEIFKDLKTGKKPAK